MNKKGAACILFFVLVIGGAIWSSYQENVKGSSVPDPVVLKGRTMGTTYEVKLVGKSLSNKKRDLLHGRVDAELIAVNRAMSTYIPDSEISTFNRSGSTLAFPVSSRFRQVLERSFDIWERTDGIFDPTIGPLIDLWGFGAEGETAERPSEAQRKAVLQATGMDLLQLTADGLLKKNPDVQINVSAIAKGYAVDRVAALVEEEGFENIYVEIGGEVVCRGVNQQGTPWRIGIQLPEPEAGRGYLQRVQVKNAALATSGDYRNFIVDDQGLRHHLIDPRTGSPASHSLVSVSVLAGNCMTADAVATALFVMGTEKGRAWAEKQPGIEALFVDRKDKRYLLTVTPGFESALLTD